MVLHEYVDDLEKIDVDHRMILALLILKVQYL